MARSRSRSAFRDQPTPQSASVHKSVYNGSSPPRRRWTRSQSRELETGPGTNGGGRQNKGGESRKLGPIEESPANTPQRPSSSRVVPGSPEDAANMSGTTILPSEPETYLDPDMMIETLPSLEREAKGVLNILVPTSADPVSIVNTAKKLRDPQNPQRKRLERFMSKLDGEAQYFGHQTYIDTKHVNQLLVAALAKKAVGTSREWSPDPILYKANCARFALDVLLADASNAQKTDAQKKAIKDLEGRFPSPFMKGLGKEQRGHRKPSLRKDTFDLALEIRTQSLLTRLEMHQNDSKFDPEAIVNGVFFDDVMADEEDSYQDAQPPLRGFNIGAFEDENGRLPERFREAVHDRINEIRVTLAEEDDDVPAMIRDLHGIYRWQKFVLRVAQWVRKRDDEINRELESQPNAEDIREDFFQEDTAQHDTSKVSSTDSPARRTVALESTVQTVPVKDVPEQTVAQGSPAKPVAKDKERRKSGKSPWLNPAMIQRLNERQQAAEGSKNRRQTDFVKPVSQRPENPSREDRRQTLPGPSAAPPEHREVPASPEGSPTLLQDEDIFADTNTHLQPPGEREHTPESSYSPPMPRRTPSVQPIEAATTGMPSSQEVWNTATSAITPRPTEGRKRTPVTFIDRQEHAHRVSPISLDSRVERADQPQPQPQPSRKRTNRALEDSDSDDEFTRYERAIDPSSKRAQKPTDTQAQARYQKRRRIDETGQPATEPQRGNTPPIPSPPAATAPVTTTRTTTTTARDNSPLPTHPRPSQGFIPESGKARSRWSPEEDSRLIRLIRECGTRWADLVRLNNAQPVREGEVRIEDRDQVHYKDRARNLKIMYYREGRENELPGQFKYVTMSSRDKKSLQKRGILVD